MDFLPLFPAIGGEGWGEEGVFIGLPLLDPLPTRPSRGEEEEQQPARHLIQWQWPLPLGVGGQVIEPFTHRLETSEIMMPVEQAMAAFELVGFKEAHWQIGPKRCLV